MSNLIKTNKGDVVKKSGGMLGMLTANKSEVGRKPIAQTDVNFYNEKLNVEGRLGFIIDATYSRSDTWEKATRIQAKLFNEVEGLEVNVMHFGGNGINQTGWHDTAEPIISHMNGVSCVSGSTKILPCIDRYLNDDKDPKVLLMIGDTYEESHESGIAKAQKMKECGIKFFALQEGDDYSANQMYRTMTEITGGSYAKFDDEATLKGLIGAIKTYAVKGVEGLKMLANSGDQNAKRIAGGMKLLGNGPV